MAKSKPAVLTDGATLVQLLAQRKALEHNDPHLYQLKPNGPTPWSAVAAGWVLHRHEWSEEIRLWHDMGPVTAEYLEKLLGAEFQPHFISKRPVYRPNRKASTASRS